MVLIEVPTADVLRMSWMIRTPSVARIKEAANTDPQGAGFCSAVGGFCSSAALAISNAKKNIPNIRTIVANLRFIYLTSFKTRLRH